MANKDVIAEQGPEQHRELNQNTTLTHKETLEITKNRLLDLLRDPLLSDIPASYVSPSEIQARIDLEKGKAFVVLLKRHSENGMNNIEMIAKNDTTVSELKKNIQISLSRIITQEGGPSCLSWKYFWRTYWLVHNNEKLSDDRKSLKEYNMKDKSEITFLKRLRRE